MKKLFCDKCEKEIKMGEMWHSLTVDKTHFDLCRECADEIKLLLAVKS